MSRVEILFEIKYRNSVLGDACLVESFAHVGFFLYWQSFWPEKPIIQGYQLELFGQVSPFAVGACWRSF